jgi:hypothetical protein
VQLHKRDPQPPLICHAAAQGPAADAERTTMAPAAPTSAAQLFYDDSRVVRHGVLTIAPPAPTPGSITEALLRAAESSFDEVLDEDANTEHDEDEAADHLELRAEDRTELLADEHGDRTEHEGDHANRHQ